MQTREAIENLKICIDTGHLYKLEENWRRAGNSHCLCWKCVRCGYEKLTNATEEQDEIISKYNRLKPEKQSIEIRKKNEADCKM